jgi:shikimate dehydrogenase
MYSTKDTPVKPDTILTLAAQPTPYAVLGSPVHHSLSPVMQQAAFDNCGFEARYYRIEVDEEGLVNAVKKMRQVPFGGWNCTVPNKVKMLELCDRRSESAGQFRAVNTVVNEKGALVGHNTDGIGWSRALREAFGRGPDEMRILLLGTGGAGRAVATQALVEKCPQLIIANRTMRKAAELIDHFQSQFPGARNVRAVGWAEKELTAALSEVDLVVNATSIGLGEKGESVLPARMIPPLLLIFDTVYGAGCAKFRQEVETAGAKWSDGLGMLLHQGAAAFTLWTGREAPLEIMRRALQNSMP